MEVAAPLHQLSLIAGAEAVRSLPEKVSTMVPTLRAGREFARVEPEQRARAVQAVADDGILVTAAAILAAVTAAPSGNNCCHFRAAASSVTRV